MEFTLESLDGFDVLLVHLEPLHLKVLELVFELSLGFSECIALGLGHVKLDLECLLDFDLACSEAVLKAELILALLEGLLVEVALAVLDPLPGLGLAELELAQLVLLKKFQLVPVLLDFLAVPLSLLDPDPGHLELLETAHLALEFVRVLEFELLLVLEHPLLQGLEGHEPLRLLLILH